MTSMAGWFMASLPALATTMSRLPKVSIAVANRRSRSGREEASARTTIARPPAASISVTMRRALSSSAE
jgi:hypothetical protein